MGRLWGWLLISMALWGCAAGNPQTRAQFVKDRQAGGVPFNMMDSYVVNRRFEDVVKSLQQKVGECLNVDVTMTRTQGGVRTMNARDEYRTSLHVLNRDRAEMTTQFHMKNQIVVQKVPEGGFYSRAVDIERASPRTTKVTYYGSSFASAKTVWAAIKEWSDGKNSPCP